LLLSTVTGEFDALTERMLIGRLTKYGVVSCVAIGMLEEDNISSSMTVKALRNGAINLRLC